MVIARLSSLSTDSSPMSSHLTHKIPASPRKQFNKVTRFQCPLVIKSTSVSARQQERHFLNVMTSIDTLQWDLVATEFVYLHKTCLNSMSRSGVQSVSHAGKNTHSRSKVGKHIRCTVGNILKCQGMISLKQQCDQVAESVILFKLVF